MDAGGTLLERLGGRDSTSVAGASAAGGSLRAEWQHTGVRFAASDARMEAQYDRAVGELFTCMKPVAGSVDPILHEGGGYMGCWLESTGTISAELLSRFLPGVAARTYAGFAAGQRSDGLLPYKLTANGPAFAQIQTVTPLARCVWNHYLLNGRDGAFLRLMYDAMTRNDAWLAQHRDTRGTGAVEAFCAYDTGHDLSARFWHVPDSPHGNDPAAYNRDNPVLPFIAPDLTANVACQRAYLARIAEELGENGAAWRAKSTASTEALFAQCFDAADGFFYDRDKGGSFVRVQSDVLLRVLACEIGDDAFFAEALSRYLLNTRKFFAKYPFTSLALDEPRFDPGTDYNTWCGATNFLSLIRAAHAFEAHGRHVELNWVIYPTLAALFAMERFSQTISPFTGKSGFAEAYSPTLLCLLDFVERLCGILPRPEGTLWFTGLVPRAIARRDVDHETSYARTVDGRSFVLVNSIRRTAAYRDGQLLFEAPAGLRIVTGRDGTVQSLIGMKVEPVAGTLRSGGVSIAFNIEPNQQLDLRDIGLVSVRFGGFVTPTY